MNAVEKPQRCHPQVLTIPSLEHQYNRRATEHKFKTIRTKLDVYND